VLDTAYGVFSCRLEDVASRTHELGELMNRIEELLGGTVWDVVGFEGVRIDASAPIIDSEQEFKEARPAVVTATNEGELPLHSKDDGGQFTSVRGGECVT